METTIDELREAKDELEISIKNLMRDFTDKYGVEISGCSLDTIRTVSGDVHTYDFRVEVRI